MRILYLTSIYENFGGYYRCLNLSRNLPAEKVYVTIVCASARNFDLLIRSRDIQDNVRLVTLPRIKYHKYFTGQLFRMFISCFQVLFYDYQILHASTVAQPQVGIPVMLAKIVRRKKVVVDWEDLWGGGFADYHPFPVRNILSFCEKFFILFSNRVTVVSEFLLQKTNTLGIPSSRIDKIPNGSNIKQIFPLAKDKSRKLTGIPPEKKVIMSVGNTYMGDVVGVIIKLIKSVSERSGDVIFAFIGNFDIDKKYKADFCSLSSHTLFFGNKDFKEIPVYMSCADILILPMADSPIEKARFPMRFGDYLAAGRPIVSNAVGEVRHYLETYNCGLISLPKDIDGMTDNIISLLNNKNLSEKLEQNARSLAEGELSWSRIAEKLMETYNKALYGRT